MYMGVKYIQYSISSTSQIIEYIEIIWMCSVLFINSGKKLNLSSHRFINQQRIKHIKLLEGFRPDP